MRRAFLLCSRTLRVSSNVKSTLNPIPNRKFDYIPKFPLFALASFDFSFSSAGIDSSNENEPSLRPETNSDDNVNSKETAIMDVEDVDNKELKSKLEEYLNKQKEDVLPAILEDILKRRLTGKHEQTDDELIEDMKLEPLKDIKDTEFEDDFNDLYETDNDIDDLYEAGDTVQKRMASNEFFNMDDKKWDEMIKEATDKGFLADMRECEEVLEDMLNWDKLLPDEIKKKVESKFDEIAARVEKGELEVKEGYDLFKEFEDEMVKKCIDIMDAEGPPQFDETDIPDKKKDLDDPPGEGPILRWQTRVVLAPGGDAWHPKNRKVKLSVTVKELGLSKHQFRRFRELAGKRYHPGGDELTIISERFEHREENRKDCLRTLFNLIEEAGKANKLVEDALTSHLKLKLKSDPHFMERLNSKKTTTATLASNSSNFSTLASNSGNFSTLASNSGNFSTLASNSGNFSTLASNSGNFSTLSSNSGNFQPVISSSSSGRCFSSKASGSVTETSDAAGKISNAELKKQIEKMYGGDEEAFITVFESILQRKLNGNSDELDAQLLNDLPNTSRSYNSQEDNNNDDNNV